MTNARLMKPAVTSVLSILGFVGFVGVGAGFFAACSDPVVPVAGVDASPAIGECGVAFIGDPAKPLEIEVRALDAQGADIALRAGADLAMIFPPQGGRVAFVGVRAKNVDPCAVRLLGAVRDPLSKQVRLDARTVNLIPKDGYGVSGAGNTDVTSDVAIAAYSNVPLCPNQWAEESIFDHPFEIEVDVTDHGGRHANAKVMVVPRCAEPAREAQCKCLCKKGYVLGEACGEDAGAPSDGGGGG